MTPTLAFIALLLVTVVWFALPLLPAFRELWWPTDVQPLQVVGRDAGDVAFFARGFRRYLEAQLRALPQANAAGDWVGKLPDGTPFLRVTQLPDALSRGPRPDGSHDRVVLIEPELTMTTAATFLMEVAARKRFGGAPGTTFRALLGEGDLELGSRSSVLRWVHAERVLLVGPGTQLYGRASAGSAMTLGRDVAFERIAAPSITVEGREEVPARSADRPFKPFEPPESAMRNGQHLRIPGDCILPEQSQYVGDLVVAGDLRLHAGARVTGSVKAHGRILLEVGAAITGALVSRTAIVVGPHSEVGGPLIAETEIAIDRSARVGAPGRLTTVVAPKVRLGPGVTVHGQINAGEGHT